jgi:DNA end-binding protein Ku
MLAIASKIVEQQAGTFNPEKFNDRYEDAVRDLIARKQKGQRIVASRPIAVASNDNADDLMAALKASIAGGSRTSRRRSSEADAGKPPARRAKPDPRVERKRAS